MLEWLLLGIANFAFVATKAWQQRNVAFLQYFKVPIGSLALATAEVYIIQRIAAGAGVIDVLGLALFGSLGCLLAMWYSRHYNGH